MKFNDWLAAAKQELDAQSCPTPRYSYVPPNTLEKLMAKSNLEIKRPFKVFRELSDPIKEEFSRLADITARKFKPRDIETSHVIDLCVNKSDQETLRAAWGMCSERVEPKWKETMKCVLARDGLVSGFYVAFETMRDGGGLNNYVLRPDYACDPTAPIESAPAELVDKMVDDINQWLELMRDITMAREVFSALNDGYPNTSREQLRYVFPAVVSLLRRVSTSTLYGGAEIGKEAAKWAAKLATPLPAHHWSPPPELRPALQHANSIVAMVSLYDDTPYERKPHQSDIYLEQRDDAKVRHPLMPWKPLELLGLCPS